MHRKHFWVRPRVVHAAQVMAPEHSPAAATTLAAMQRILISRHVGRRDEAQLLEFLSSANSADLNYLLARIKLPRLISAIDDRIIGPDNRTQLMNLLTVKRIHEISISNRVLLIDALQMGWTDRKKEIGIKQIFLATKSHDLTELKNSIDSGDEYHDLHKLIWEDIDDDVTRNEILQHIAIESVPTDDIKIIRY